jgi:protein-S-isoprenylcysteine O-methyltransferase Ste14
LGPAFSWYWAPTSTFLVRKGIYRWLKHPLLLGYFMETAALVLASVFPSWLCGLLIGGTACVTMIQAVGEERRLEMKFGQDWRAFAAGKWV